MRVASSPRIYRFSHYVGRAKLKREHLADQVLTATDECRTGVAAVAPQQFQTRFAVGVEAGKRHVHSASRQEGLSLPFLAAGAQVIAAPLQILANQANVFIRQT